MAESTILTGQFVRINQVPASAGERILTISVDYIFLFIYLLSSIFILDLLKLLNRSEISTVIFLFILYLPMLCYSLLMEVFNNGQSLGKMLLGIRVVKLDGSRPTLSSYLLRWLLFIVDVPLTGGLGLLVILLTQNNQRLGDLAAGTMVIKEKNYKKIQVSLDEFDFLTENYHPTFPQAADLSLEQINVILKTLESPSKKRTQLIAQLSKKIRELLAVNSHGMNDTLFLQTLIRDYQYYALEII